jgi:hypothetical protein
MSHWHLDWILFITIFLNPGSNQDSQIAFGFYCHALTRVRREPLSWLSRSFSAAHFWRARPAHLQRSILCTALVLLQGWIHGRWILQEHSMRRGTSYREAQGCDCRAKCDHLFKWLVLVLSIYSSSCNSWVILRQHQENNPPRASLLLSKQTSPG